MSDERNTTLWSSTIFPDVEPMPISITRGEWYDDQRHNRKIAYKVYCPDTKQADTYPVILWSHGLGGSRDGAGFISRFVASHGFVIVHLTHVGTDSSLWEGKPGHPWDVIRATHIPKSATLQRFKDIPFALKQIPKLDCANLMDMSKMGMSGHSFGAMTTQIMAGQKRGYGHRQYSLYRPEFKAGIVYSPVPFRKKKQHVASDFYGGIRIPLLMMTGTQDDSPIEQFGYQERVEVFTHSGGPDQHLLVLNDGDHMVYNGSRGQLQDNPKRDVHETIVKILSLAFWQAYLKDDANAYHWLTGEGVQHWLAHEGVYQFRK